jgi:hypothetical protein
MILTVMSSQLMFHSLVLGLTDVAMILLSDPSAKIVTEVLPTEVFCVSLLAACVASIAEPPFNDAACMPARGALLPVDSFHATTKLLDEEDAPQNCLLFSAA